MVICKAPLTKGYSEVLSPPLPPPPPPPPQVI